jgi:hypothetical protein
MQTFGRILSVAVALLVFAGAASAQDAVQLSYKLKKDDKLIYKSAATIKQTQMIMNMKIVNDISQNAVTQLSVQGTDDKGNIQIKSENKSLLFKMKAANVLDYTSRSTPRKKTTTRAACLAAP